MNYRVWCVNKNEWEKDEVAMLQNGNLVQIRNMQPLRKETHVVEFSTGIKDVRGVEIFEGDIVSALKIEYIGEVLRKASGESSINGYIGLYTNKCLIIGNIHENKDLLEVN